MALLTWFAHGAAAGGGPALARAHMTRTRTGPCAPTALVPRLALPPPPSPVPCSQVANVTTELITNFNTTLMSLETAALAGMGPKDVPDADAFFMFKDALTNASYTAYNLPKAGVGEPSGCCGWVSPLRGVGSRGAALVVPVARPPWQRVARPAHQRAVTRPAECACSLSAALSGGGPPHLPVAANPPAAPPPPAVPASAFVQLLQWALALYQNETVYTFGQDDIAPGIKMCHR